MRNGDSCWIEEFRVRRPPHESLHACTRSWLAWAHARAEAAVRGDGFDEDGFRERLGRDLERYGGAAGIERRGHELDDFLHRDSGRMRVFREDGAPGGLGIDARMRFYDAAAGAAFDDLFPEDAPPPGMLLHVTCTGYLAPTPAQRLVSRRGWGRIVALANVYHMGCYAAVPAVRLAWSSTAATGVRTEIVHTELCSLHADLLDHSPQQLVIQSLFADGHIRYAIRRGPGTSPAFRILAVHEEILPGTADDMTWVPSGFGLAMTLSRGVPARLRDAVDGFVDDLAQKAELDPRAAREEAWWAVHPGGPRILDEVERALAIQPERMAHSRGVLRECGNMSSATLPHVWKRLLEDDTVPSGALVVSIGFGPGLTAVGAMFRKS